MKKRLLIGCLAAAGVVVLILDAATAIKAAQEAVQLCVHAIIPSLFPFFVLINLLGSALSGFPMKWFAPLEKLMHLPKGSGGVFLCGSLGGYPTGAQLVRRSWEDGLLNTEDAQRMLAFCSNAGPAFLFGMVGPLFDCAYTAWIIWGIHLISSVLVGCLYPKTDHQSASPMKPVEPSVGDSLKRAVTVMGYVCGWVVLFRVIAAFLLKWFLWRQPTELQVVAISILELANGCAVLDLVENEGLRMVIASLAVNFGGICVLMQTSSVIGGLTIGTYIKGKLFQTVFATILSIWAQFFLYSTGNHVHPGRLMLCGLTAVLIMMALLLRKSNFTVDFPVKMLYNVNNRKRKG